MFSLTFDVIEDYTTFDVIFFYDVATTDVHDTDSTGIDVDVDVAKIMLMLLLLLILLVVFDGWLVGCSGFRPIDVFDVTIVNVTVQLLIDVGTNVLVAASCY